MQAAFLKCVYVIVHNWSSLTFTGVWALVWAVTASEKECHCVSTTFPLVSLISMHGKSWVHTPGFEMLTVCLLMSSTSVFQGLHPHFLLALVSKRRTKGGRNPQKDLGFSSLILNPCDEGCWKPVRQRRKEEKSNPRALLFWRSSFRFCLIIFLIM